MADAMNIDLLRAKNELADMLAMYRAENARLTAEVERLTPKPMTLEECCDVLNSRSYNNEAWRIVSACDGYWGVRGQSTKDGIPQREAAYIAQGLLRDAGPIAGPLGQEVGA